MNHKERQTMAERTAKARLRAGYPKTGRASAAMDISERSLRRIEAGAQIPGAEVLFEMSRLYRCSSDWLLGLSARRHLG